MPSKARGSRIYASPIIMTFNLVKRTQNTYNVSVWRCETEWNIDASSTI